jgi:hypothetical protein
LGFYLNEARLFGRERQSARHCLPDLFTFPPRPHDAGTRVTVRAQQQMSNFTGDRTTEEELSFKLGIIAYRTGMDQSLKDWPPAWSSAI